MRWTLAMGRNRSCREYNQVNVSGFPVTPSKHWCLNKMADIYWKIFSIKCTVKSDLLYKATIKFYGLCWQVVFHDREDDLFFRLCQANDEIYLILVGLSQSHYTGNLVSGSTILSSEFRDSQAQAKSTHGLPEFNSCIQLPKTWAANYQHMSQILQEPCHVPYCDWWLSWQRLNALMIVSRLYHIAIQKHVLPSVHYSDVNMNICISTE